MFENLATPEDEDRYIQGAKNFDFDGNLGPYPIEWGPRWTELSQFIGRDVIEKIEVR